MKTKVFFLFLILALPIFSQETIKQRADSLILINPRPRGLDIVSAYNTLKATLASSDQIFFKLKDGTIIKDITRVTSLPQHTIIYIISTPTSQVKHYFIPVENIVSINHT